MSRSLLGSILPVLAIVGLFTAAGGARGAWIELDDFEDGYGFTGSPVTLPAGTTNGWATTANTRRILADPDANFPSNEVLEMNGSGSMIRGGLSTPIADDSTGTLYFRFYKTATTSSIGVSLSDIDGGNPTTGSGPFLQVGDPSTGAASLTSYRDSGTGTLAPIGSFDANAWYSVWMVVHNNAGASASGNPHLDTVELWMKRDDGTGPFATQTQLTWNDGGNPNPLFTFRTDKAGSLTNFFFRPNSNHGTGDIIYFDDVYMDNTGSNLTLIPEPTGYFLAGIGMSCFAVVRRMKCGHVVRK
jgi:hypothetical protein